MRKIYRSSHLFGHFFYQEAVFRDTFQTATARKSDLKNTRRCSQRFTQSGRKACYQSPTDEASALDCNAAGTAGKKSNPVRSSIASMVVVKLGYVPFV